MILFLILTLVVVLYLVLKQSVSDENSIKYLFIFILFAFIYYLGIPLEMLLNKSSIEEYGIFINNRLMQILVTMGILAIVGFGLGYTITGKLQSVKLKTGETSNILFLSIVALFAVSVIMLLTLFPDSVFRSNESYASNVAETYTNPLYAYTKDVFIYASAVLISVLAIKGGYRVFIALALTLTMILFGIKTSDKDPLLLSVIGWGIPLFSLLTKFGLQKVKTYFILFSLLVILIPSLSLLFAVNRSNKVEAFIPVIKANGIYKHFDAAGPYKTLIEELNEVNPEFEYGKTYYWSFVSWVPKSLWPNRPLDLAESYARKNISNWKSGQGYGYSLLAEAYKNFGVPGAFIQFLFIGLIIGGITFLNRWLFNGDTLSESIFFVWVTYNMAIMHRGQFNLPSSYIRFILPFLFCYFSLYFCNKIIVRWRTKRV